MKTETIEKGNELLNKLKKLIDFITDVVDGRLHYYTEQAWHNDGTGTLYGISIFSMPEVKGQDSRKLHLNFNGGEQLSGDLVKLISPEAAKAIEYASVLYREQISAILLREEKSIQKEFDNLKE